MLIPRLRRAGELVSAHPVEGPPRVSDLDSYLSVQGWALQKYTGGQGQPPAYTWRGGALVHQTARLDEPVHVVGPAMIGPHSRIEAGAIIVGPSVIGNGCTVRSGGVIGRSVCWARCRVGAQAVLDRCLVTTGASIEPNGSLYGMVYRAQKSD
jgi:NDP-sugar pyrophosphorylase family protein